MPVYDFYCSKCDEIFEGIENVGETKSKCPVCDSNSIRVFTTDGLHLKKCEYVPPPLASRKFGDKKPTMHKRYRWH